ncbi:hypothetical protein ERX27_02530 [Macrococcus brunensis]|uniref:Succinate dehydrogenase n=1 Tax=Macrococcus brunensis TaxID=198483 RepID=A0A4R6BFL8_9STAP|nr:hypothetical protein [Macrococcus brunensis]TDL98671.1 hypothetical protein ERX27_02530 [Macrococcus brunensis]ULG73707.1 hypothetical protein MGG13_08360 [Macrococcus brunensis]
MKHSRRYFIISVVLVILSMLLSVKNPLLSQIFGSVTSIILFSGLVNAIILIISVIMLDRYMKQPDEEFQLAAKIWQFVILAVIIYHLISGMLLFGII